MTKFDAYIGGKHLRVEAPSEDVAKAFVGRLRSEAERAQSIALDMGLSEASAKAAYNDIIDTVGVGTVRITEDGKPTTPTPKPAPLPEGATAKTPDSLREILRQSQETKKAATAIELKERAKDIYKGLGIESEEVQTKGF